MVGCLPHSDDQAVHGHLQLLLHVVHPASQGVEVEERVPTAQDERNVMGV